MAPDALSESASIRHFKGINTNWDREDRPGAGFARTDASRIPVAELQEDTELEHALAQAFDDDPVGEFQRRMADPVQEAHAWRVLSGELQHGGDDASSITALERAVERLPSHPAWRSRLADLYEEAGDAAAAEHQAAIAKELREASPLLHVQAGRWAVRHGDFVKARRAFEDALALQPRQVAATFNLLRVLQRLKLTDEIRDLARAWAGEPPGGEVEQRLAALICSAAGDFDQAANHLERAIRTNPASAGAYFQLADLRFRTGAYEAARDAVETAMDLERSGIPLEEFHKHYYLVGDLAIFWPVQPAECHALHARVLLHLGDLEQAENAAREATRLNPLNPHYQAILLDIAERAAAPVDDSLPDEIEELALRLARAPVDSAMGSFKQNELRLGNYLGMIRLLHRIDRKDAALDLAQEAAAIWPDHAGIERWLRNLGD
jgi:tetratricopeptide (TPR) repeat protein